jgi:hypothetical protein
MLAGYSSREALGNRHAAKARARVNHAFGEGKRENSTRQKPYRRLGAGHFLPSCGSSCRQDVVNFAGPKVRRPKEQRREALASPALLMNGMELS